MQRVYRNATGINGAITLKMSNGDYIDLGGSNGSSGGSLSSLGALGDSVSIFCDVAGHWYAYPAGGTWTNS
jgi:hypothetical protein